MCLFVRVCLCTCMRVFVTVRIVEERGQEPISLEGGSIEAEDDIMI